MALTDGFAARPPKSDRLLASLVSIGTVVSGYRNRWSVRPEYALELTNAFKRFHCRRLGHATVKELVVNSAYLWGIRALAGDPDVSIKQLLRDYALASYYGSGRHVAAFPLTATQVARARLRHGIGPFHFSLLGLAQVEESGWDDYILMGPAFDQRRAALSPGKIHGLVDNKILFYEHCLRAGLPTIPVICHVGGEGDRLGCIVEHVDSPARFEELLRAASSELFVKPTSGAHGDGIFHATRHDDGFEFDGRQGTAADFLGYLECKRDTPAGFIVQSRIRPHAEMLPLASANGLPTVRVITAMYDDGPKVLFACLRIPVGVSLTDNFGKGTNGNLVAGVDVESGTLMAARGSCRHDWPVMVQVDVHPDSGHRIGGSHLPFWAETAQLALRAQESLPDVKTIGWDVSATADGVLLVELNSNYGVHSLQVAYQRGLKTELAAKLGITLD